ncbi:MAG: hypothetical protein ACK4IT_03820 [Thioalkalivibrionaceae bacterium]
MNKPTDPATDSLSEQTLRTHRERLEIAALTGEILNLMWSPKAGQVRAARLRPQAVEFSGGQWLLRAIDLDDEKTLTIPLASIRNLPSPDKTPLASD